MTLSLRVSRVQALRRARHSPSTICGCATLRVVSSPLLESRRPSGCAVRKSQTPARSRSTANGRWLALSGTYRRKRTGFATDNPFRSYADLYSCVRDSVYRACYAMLEERDKGERWALWKKLPDFWASPRTAGLPTTKLVWPLRRQRHHAFGEAPLLSRAHENASHLVVSLIVIRSLDGLRSSSPSSPCMSNLAIQHRASLNRIVSL
ncbi:hypothetical protein C8T65DRAFT_285356 [Cerioporus squamosus]|nr:hypothetical protein C8T65DRAFT_285356 [Cerioporus squamosus]